MRRVARRTQNAISWKPVTFDVDSRRRGTRRSESGSVLILAIVYITAISLIVGALADWAMNDLNSTTHFRSASSLGYAATNVTEEHPLHPVDLADQFAEPWLLLDTTEWLRFTTFQYERLHRGGLVQHGAEPRERPDSGRHLLHLP
jgi:hypothetical protein